MICAYSLTAQNTDSGKNFVGAKVLFIDYGIPNNVDGTSITNGLEVIYKRNINQYLAVGVPLKAGIINTPNAVNNQNFFSADITLRGQYYQSMALLNPYVFAGVGYISETTTMLNNGGMTGSSFLQIPAGIGTDIRIGDNSYVNIQAEYRTSSETLRDNLQLGVGLNFRLSKGNNQDADGDGVPDAEDACPQLAGSADLQGCPDTDGDGVTDQVDECPDEAGTIERAGCPDRDGDGVPDSEDECPLRAGDVNGCPDADGDGVTDNNDPCPLEVGPINGCPDSDGDGVADKDDRCPDQAGSPSLGGCPDRDNDGIRDSNDECPDEAGTFANRGCPEEEPDYDEDGVPDNADPCPNEAGPLNGCPDRDGDGIRDQDDNCPDRAGSPGNQGCPEENLSNQEEEPPAAETPMIDEEGVMNKAMADQMEAERALEVANDRDRDGVPDAEDGCPNAAGPASNLGCPGMRSEDLKMLDVAMREVQFEPAKAILLEESKQILDQIAGIMSRYPEFNLKISGHTDNIGDDETNQYLSEERAKACFLHLVAAGVDPTRMYFIGYGENMPLTSNRTRYDRQRNRRVEFVLYIKK